MDISENNVVDNILTKYFINKEVEYLIDNDSSIMIWWSSQQYVLFYMDGDGVNDLAFYNKILSKIVESFNNKERKYFVEELNKYYNIQIEFLYFNE